MKLYQPCLVAAAVVATCFTVSVAAQTCASPLSYNTPPSAPTATGDTCAASDAVALYCGSLDSSGKNDVVYQINVGASKTATQITITGGGAGFTPSLFIYSDACNTANNCLATGDTSTPADLSGVGPGTYYMAISAGPSEAAGACGTYAITADGTLPVKLQNFSVN